MRKFLKVSLKFQWKTILVIFALIVIQTFFQMEIIDLFSAALTGVKEQNINLLVKSGSYMLMYTGIFWRKNTRSREDKLLIRMILVCFFSCIVEPMAFLLDGVPGLASHILGFLCNTGAYAANILIGPIWSFLIAEHITYKLSRRHMLAAQIISVTGAATLIINIFFPIAFSFIGFKGKDTLFPTNNHHLPPLFLSFVGILSGHYLKARIIIWNFQKKTVSLPSIAI